MNPNTKGALGEHGVIKYLLSKSLPVFKSICDNSRIDLVTEVDGKLVKIQVKTTSSKDGKAWLYTKKSCLNRKYNYSYEEGDVDVFALYVDDIDRVFFISSKEATKNTSSFTLRFTKPGNNQVKNINFADDYLDFEKALRD